MIKILEVELVILLQQKEVSKLDLKVNFLEALTLNLEHRGNLVLVLRNQGEHIVKAANYVVTLVQKLV